MASCPPIIKQYWIERVSSAVDQAAVEYQAADQQLDDAQRLAVQRRRDAAAKVKAVIREVAEERREAGGQESDGETSATILKLVSKQQSAKKSKTKEQTKLLAELLEEAQEAETGYVVIQPSATQPQCAEQSQASQQLSFLQEVSGRNELNSSSETQSSTSTLTQSRPKAQLRDPLGYAHETVNSLTRKIRDLSTLTYTDESMQLLAAMWMNIVEMRHADPEEAKIRNADIIAQQVVTEERRAAARSITEPLKDLSDWQLLSLQKHIERAWHEFQQTLELPNGVGSCILL